MNVKFPINKCPICGGDVFKYGPNQWFRCSVMVHMGDRDTPHYQVEKSGSSIVQHVCLPPLLLNTNECMISSLYEINKNGDFKHIYDFDAQPITPSLLQRLRKLIVFT